jgi:hypothetical protein
MRRITIAGVIGVVVAAMSTPASADTLVLRDGTRVEGTAVSMTARTITFRHSDGMSRRYPTSQVESLTFVSADRANGNSASGPSLQMPAGTYLRIRTTEVIESRKSGIAQLFSGIVDRDVETVDGVTVPRGASAQLLIRQVVGDEAASRDLVLDVESITIAGRRYQTTAAPALTQGAGGVSSPGASGTIIGSMTGSGTGFAGVLSGSGADAGDVGTRGPEVRVPAQTLLEFRLERAVTLQGRALGK